MINSDRVTEIFKECLYKNDEIVKGNPIIPPIIVNGITFKLGLYPDRVNKFKNEINEMIDNLPTTFKTGDSFLNLCKTKDGDFWTGLHTKCEELMVLGIAIERMNYCHPRDMWNMLQGNLPHLIIFDRR